MKTQASKTLKVAVTGAAALGRRKVALAVCLALCTLGLGFSANAQEGTFVTFDAPGAGMEAFSGTFPFAIDPAGAITGTSCSALFTCQGFLRAPDGTFTTFDTTATYPSGINPEGAIAGSGSAGGFLRIPDGTVTTFNAPDGGFLFGFSPVFSINPSGTITGPWADPNFVIHGFLRASDGTITTFDAPGAGTSFFQALPFGINPNGTVAGCYIDANGVGHGFVRARDGTLTTFDPPNSTNLSCFAFSFGFFIVPDPVGGINPAGSITGSYFEPISGNPFGGNYRGFLRAKDGSFTTFDAVPSPSSPCCTWTNGIAINPAGEIAGFDNDYISVNHGFVRGKDGTVTILDAPGAGTGFIQGTLALSINPAGQVAGFYSDANSVYHGFVWIPPSQ
jgi:hypothetical protein